MRDDLLLVFCLLIGATLIASQLYSFYIQQPPRSHAAAYYEGRCSPEKFLQASEVPFDISDDITTSPSGPGSVFAEWGLSEEEILSDEYNPAVHEKWFSFLHALLNNVTNEEQLSETSARQLFGLHEIMRNRPVANVSLLAPCTVEHINLAIPFLISILMQTVVPAETLMVFSVPNEADSELTTSRLHNLGIPQFRIFLRGGMYFAADNRKYLAKKSKYPVLIFFDCDDFMHPQKTQFLSTVFETHPDLEASLHGYQGKSRGEFIEKGVFEFLNEFSNNSSDMANFAIQWPYQDFWNQEPIIHHNDSAPEWIADDPATEPNHIQDVSTHWWYNIGIELDPPHQYAMANGWVTIRKELLETVPYPSIRYGEDALFNWRILRNKRNFTVIDKVLGAYVK